MGSPRNKKIPAAFSPDNLAQASALNLNSANGITSIIRPSLMRPSLGRVRKDLIESMTKESVWPGRSQQTDPGLIDALSWLQEKKNDT